MRWRDIRFEKPTEADGDEDDLILQLLADGSIGKWRWDSLVRITAWMPLSELPAFDPIPDPPKGWRFVDKENDARNDQAKFWDEETKHWGLVNPHLNHWLSTHTYIVPIKPPEPQYRPFANAAEFEPYCDKWWRYKSMGGDEHNPPALFNNVFHCNRHWSDSFETKVFCDGTPFGVRVE
jgi:hypothetical protein